MNPEVKQKWLDALRSGEYVQTTGWLHTTTSDVSGYCCLGVLCDLAVKEQVIEPAVIHNTALGVWAYGEDGDISALPRDVASWAGLESCDPIIERTQNSLAEMNDDGMSFVKIAQIIEDEL